MTDPAGQVCYILNLIGDGEANSHASQLMVASKTYSELWAVRGTTNRVGRICVC